MNRHICRVAVLILIGVCSALPVAATTGDQPRPPTVAFMLQEDQAGSSAISLVKPGEANPVEVFRSEGRVTAPIWSTDGAQLAWGETVFEGEVVSRVYTAEPDGSDVEILVETTTAVELTPLEWSPDGTTLAYQDDRAIWLAGQDLGPRQVTFPQGDRDVDGGATWSPDGDMLAFTRLTSQTPDADVFAATAALVDLPSGVVRLLLEDAVTQSWSPDGRWISYLSNPFATSSQARRIDLVSPGGQQQTLPRRCDAGPPAWSPTGQHLACTSVSSTTQQPNQLVTIDVDTQDVQVLADHGASPSWSSDGLTVSYTVTGQSDVDTGIWAVPTGGGAPQLIAGPFSSSIKRILGPAVQPAPIVRIAGPSRIETAIDVSVFTFDSAPAAVLARADAYADALAAAPVAAALSGPILLTPSDQLMPQVLQELIRLDVSRVHLMGGPAALSADVEDSLDNLGLDVTRSSGATRFDTARQAATFSPAPNAYIVEGANDNPARGWPDAVAVAGLAAFQGQPILPVTRDTIPPQTLQAITDQQINEVTIIGSPVAVSEAVEAELRNLGLTVNRLAGNTRYETSELVADAALQAGMVSTQPWAVSGTNWPDSLAVAAAAANTGQATVLVDPTAQPTTDWLANQPALDRIIQVGGPAALSPATAQAIAQALLDSD